MTMKSELDEVLSALIYNLSGLSEDELFAAIRMVERAYTHLMVEQALRGRSVGVS
jgi:hypothetical protein